MKQISTKVSHLGFKVSLTVEKRLYNLGVLAYSNVFLDWALALEFVVWFKSFVTLRI
jgi:hypothetical protein